MSDGEWTYTWQNGRQLARMQTKGVAASFIYNENGLRVQKTVNGVVTNYTLHGKNIVHMTQGSNKLHFFYDALNKPAVIVYNGTSYSYVKNLQGDIVAILDINKNVVVSYVYDAWGRPVSKAGSLASTLGTVQPFRYRGYVYDEETGLCYLQSRYFSIQYCRFVNADRLIEISQLRALNQFSYCLNQPIKLIDPTGFTYEDLQAEHDFDHDSPYMECHPGGGGFSWNSFRRSLNAAADGLKMAVGKQSLPCMEKPSQPYVEKHHLLSDKNRKYTPLFEDIVGKYDMHLNGMENIVALENHRGRHTYVYHEFMLNAIKELDSLVENDVTLFYEGFAIIREIVLERPWLPYAK